MLQKLEMKISEQEIISKYIKLLTFNNKESLKLEDDIYYSKKRKLVFSTDTYIEGTHFLNSSNPTKFVKKIFRSSLSDIFSKGSKPITYFLSLSLNRSKKNWLKKFINELKVDSKKYGIFLGGGDTVKSKKLSITFSILGHAYKIPILRKNAKINDDIYITRYIGDSYVGLLLNKKKLSLNKYKRYFLKSFENPDLPAEFSKNLYKFANSSIDISDGLIKDLGCICSSSKCGAEVNFRKLPFSTKLKHIASINKISLIDVFSKGDDYQILFTANKKFRKLIKSVSKKTNTKTTIIGKIVSSKNVKMLDDNKIINLSGSKTGYIHNF